MTCVVCGDRWMAADRRISGVEGGVSSLVKIAQSTWLIAAASGNATSTLDVKRAVRKGAQTPEDLIEHVDKESYALVLLPDGRCWRVEDARAWLCPPGLQGIGSGADLALGWLSGVGKDHANYIRQAFRFVAARRSDCGGGVDIRRLK